MGSSRTLLVDLSERRRALTRVLMLVEGRGFTVRGVRSTPITGAHAEIEVDGDDGRLTHLTSRLAQLPDVLAISTSPDAHPAPPPNTLRLERLRVHVQAESGGIAVTDVTVTLNAHGSRLTAAGDGVSVVSATEAAVRAALRQQSDSGHVDLLCLTECTTNIDRDGSTVVAVTAHDGKRQHTGTARNVNPLLAAAEAVVAVFDLGIEGAPS